MSYPRPRMCSAQPFLQWVHVGRPFWWVVRNGLGGQTLTLSTRTSQGMPSCQTANNTWISPPWPDSTKPSNLSISLPRTTFKNGWSSRTDLGDRASLSGFLAVECTLGCSLKLVSAFFPDQFTPPQQEPNASTCDFVSFSASDGDVWKKSDVLSCASVWLICNSVPNQYLSPEISLVMVSGGSVDVLYHYYTWQVALTQNFNDRAGPWLVYCPVGFLLNYPLRALLECDDLYIGTRRNNICEILYGAWKVQVLLCQLAPGRVHDVGAASGSWHHVFPVVPAMGNSTCRALSLEGSLYNQGTEKGWAELAQFCADLRAEEWGSVSVYVDGSDPSVK